MSGMSVGTEQNNGNTNGHVVAKDKQPHSHGGNGAVAVDPSNTSTTADVSDTETLHSWNDGATQITNLTFGTTTTTTWQWNESRGVYCCLNHPQQETSNSSNSYCPLCEQEGQAQRNALKKQRDEIREQLQLLQQQVHGVGNLVGQAPQGQSHQNHGGIGTTMNAGANNTAAVPPPAPVQPPAPPAATETVHVPPPAPSSHAAVPPAPVRPPTFEPPVSSATPPSLLALTSGQLQTTSPTDALTLQLQRMQQMQDWMLLQKEQECLQLKQALEEARCQIQELKVENALLTEKLVHKQHGMQRELKFLKVAFAQKLEQQRLEQQQHRTPLPPTRPATTTSKNKHMDMHAASTTSSNTTPSVSNTTATASQQPEQSDASNSKTPRSSLIQKSVWHMWEEQTKQQHQTPPPPSTKQQAVVTPSKNENDTPQNKMTMTAAPKSDNESNKKPTDLPPPAATTTPPQANTNSDNVESEHLKTMDILHGLDDFDQALQQQHDSNSFVLMTSNTNTSDVNQQESDEDSFLVATDANPAPVNPTPPTQAPASGRNPRAASGFLSTVYHGRNPSNVSDLGMDDEALIFADTSMEQPVPTAQSAEEHHTSSVPPPAAPPTLPSHNTGNHYKATISNPYSSRVGPSGSSLSPSKASGGQRSISFPDDANSVTQTVASSTFGEDRQTVSRKSILDPYGDHGIYTGVILRSTGMPHGAGQMLYQEDKRTYDGEWRHGRWHGYGKATFANGDNYVGEYRFDQRHGRGRYEWNDGRVYDGLFREDKRHGKGKFEWPDGAVYDGEFRNGQREGQGRYKFADGGCYEGSWKDGRYSGFGICSWEDGRCYKGEWLNGMAHGKGVETFADGTIRHDGLWEEDEPVI